MTRKQEKAKCPICNGDEYQTIVRQYPDMPGVIDVGFMCRDCGHEWGFEAS